MKRPCGDGRTVLDVGSGAGRNAAFLAMAGFDVIAVDRDARLLDKTQALLENYSTHPCMPWHVERGEVRCVQRTLGAHLQRDREWLQDNAADVVLVVRFLRRGVLQLLPGAVREGGVLLYEHFLMGCEKFGGPNKRAQMLERGELAAIFAPPLFRILLDEESTLSDGRPITRFICQRLPNT